MIFVFFHHGQSVIQLAFRNRNAVSVKLWGQVAVARKFISSWECKSREWREMKRAKDISRGPFRPYHQEEDI